MAVSSLPEEQFTCFDTAEELHLAEGEHIARQGEVGRYFWMLLEGELRIYQTLPEGRDMTMAMVEAGTARIEAERVVLGLDHAEVGARLCERWSFPDVLVDAVRFHHEPERATCDPVLACFVHLGEQLRVGHRFAVRVTNVSGYLV